MQFLYESQLIKEDLETTSTSPPVSLSGADLSGAYLIGADLSGATVTDEQLDAAHALLGATMPDGSKHDQPLCLRKTR